MVAELHVSGTRPFHNSSNYDCAK